MEKLRFNKSRATGLLPRFRKELRWLIRSIRPRGFSHKATGEKLLFAFVWLSLIFTLELWGSDLLTSFMSGRHIYAWQFPYTAAYVCLVLAFGVAVFRGILDLRITWGVIKLTKKRRPNLRQIVRSVRTPLLLSILSVLMLPSLVIVGRHLIGNLVLCIIEAAIISVISFIVAVVAAHQ